MVYVVCNSLGSDNYRMKKPPPIRRGRPSKAPETSWQKVSQWYDKSVGQEGHYYHQQVVLPGVIRLLDVDAKGPRSLIDLACGQGVLARQLPSHWSYLGLDLSSNLIKQAQSYDKNPKHKYLVHDVTEPLTDAPQVDAATCILALQNIERGDLAIRCAGSYVKPGGQLILVLNHPCFRIPRQSFWQIDEKKQCRYRRLERYFTPMKIPIQMAPSKGEESPSTWSFHNPLSTYTQWLHDSGFSISSMEEWCSDKQSTGKAARMENLSRKEFPLFLTIIAKKW